MCVITAHNVSPWSLCAKWHLAC